MCIACLICANNQENKINLGCTWCSLIANIPNINELRNVGNFYASLCESINNMKEVLCGNYFNNMEKVQCSNCRILKCTDIIKKQMNFNYCGSGNQSFMNSLYFDNIKNLYCWRCPLVTNIPYIKGLKVIRCQNCQLLTNIPMIEGLKTLICVNCPVLTNIPIIEGLHKLNCCHSTLLKIIPLIQGLKKLLCSNCPSLANIPMIQGLITLDCSNCPMLKNIPKINTLKKLFCKDCRLITSIPPNLSLLLCKGCPWINTKRRIQIYKKNTKQLLKLQNWFKKLLLAKYLLKLIPELMPLYYHPDAKGGFLHKMKLLKWIKTV